MEQELGVLLLGLVNTPVARTISRRLKSRSRSLVCWYSVSYTPVARMSSRKPKSLSRRLGLLVLVHVHT